MKKGLLVLGFALVAAGLFAAGAQEDPLAPYRESVKLSGTLQFTDGIPTLSSGGKVYGLMAHGFLHEAQFLKPGTPLEVEGYKMYGTPRGMVRFTDRKDLEYVWVNKVTLGGKTYDLQGSFGGPARGRGGMMYGPWNGPGSNDPANPPAYPRGRWN
ncbi:MAG TPA: hypothetical protein PLG79_02210 [Spirochaetales bacterium]|nr:hypothetical protein [Spirochaetales bacterium]